MGQQDLSSLPKYHLHPESSHDLLGPMIILVEICSSPKHCMQLETSQTTHDFLGPMTGHN